MGRRPSAIRVLLRVGFCEERQRTLVTGAWGNLGVILLLSMWNLLNVCCFWSVRLLVGVIVVARLPCVRMHTSSVKKQNN